MPNRLRRLVAERAAYRCEYCLIHQQGLVASHNVDHIIPLKHNGATVADNLALACADCNRNKGSDIAVIDLVDGTLMRLFNPRQDVWHEHFSLDGGEVIGLTKIGQGTVQLLMMNEPWRISQRTNLQKIGWYPLD